MPLISYAGPRRADISFVAAKVVQLREWEKAVKEAVTKKLAPPPQPTIRDDTLYLKSGSTATVSAEELEVIRTHRADVFRYIQVHQPPNVPQSLRKSESRSDVKVEPNAESPGEAAVEPPVAGKATGKTVTTRAQKTK